MSTLPPAPYAPLTDSRPRVVVTDIDMTIGAMCRFLIKWVIASIPALLIVWAILFVIGIVLALIMGTFMHGTGAHSPWHML